MTRKELKETLLDARDVLSVQLAKEEHAWQGGEWVEDDAVPPETRRAYGALNKLDHCIKLLDGEMEG